MNLIVSQTIHILCYSPISLITYLVLGRMLKIRRHVLFAFLLTGIHVFFHILYTTAIYFQIPWADPARTVIQIALDLIVPVIFSDRKPWIAVLGGSLTLMAGIVGEMVSLFTFSALKGTFDIHGMTDPFANPTAYIAMYAINLTVTLIFLAIVWFLWIRIVEKSRPEIVWYYLLFPTSQVVLLAVAGIYCTTYNMPLNRYLYLLVAAIFCFAADFFPNTSLNMRVKSLNKVPLLMNARRRMFSSVVRTGSISSRYLGTPPVTDSMSNISLDETPSAACRQNLTQSLTGNSEI